MTHPIPGPGDPAPTFSCAADGGTVIGSDDFANTPFVLFFYPKDDTPTCTTEANDFSAAAADFATAGVGLIGMSKDSAKKHDKFRTKYSLALRLGSDEHGDICERFGVWTEKSMYGKTYMGIERSTFLIGADGRIAAVWRGVKVKGHVAEVLAAARAL